MCVNLRHTHIYIYIYTHWKKAQRERYCLDDLMGLANFMFIDHSRTRQLAEAHGVPECAWHRSSDEVANPRSCEEATFQEMTTLRSTEMHDFVSFRHACAGKKPLEQPQMQPSSSWGPHWFWQNSQRHFTLCHLQPLLGEKLMGSLLRDTNRNSHPCPKTNPR